MFEQRFAPSLMPATTAPHGNFPVAGSQSGRVVRWPFC